MDEGPDGQNLMDAARGLAGAFSDLLKAAQDGTNGKKDVRNGNWERNAMLIISVMSYRDTSSVSSGVLQEKKKEIKKERVSKKQEL